MRPPLLLVVLALLAGCDGDGLTDKTYPPAGDFTEIPFVDLFAAQFGAGDISPGSYNVTAWVSRVNACPRDANCFTADSIVIASSLAHDPVQPALTLSPNDVRQFQEGARYLFSVEVEPGREGALVTLLGYDRL